MTPAPVRSGDRRALEEAAAAWIGARLAARARQGAAVFAACGGRSVGGILRALASADVAWGRVHVFMVDERVVAPDDEQSNLRLVRESLLDPLVARGRLPPANVHPLITDPRRPRVDLERSERELAALGGRFDVALLSAGEDGHVAGLFPHHASIRDPATFYIATDDAPKPPPRRVSASRALLERSGAAVLLFLGEGKRPALARFLNAGVDAVACPARLVAALPETLVLTDLEDA